MSTTQRSPTKVWSILGKAIQTRMYLSSPSLATGLYRGSVSFRTGKGGFKVPKYQNTYRLESYNHFKCEIVDKILMDVMQSYLTGLKYQPQVCMRICQRISAEVRDRICKKSYDRYKVVVVVSIVQKLGQNVQIDFGKLWDFQRDTYSTYMIETPEFAAVGLVVGAYYE